MITFVETDFISKEKAFREIRAYCSDKPGASECYPWGDVAWKVNGKMFACGGEDNNTFTVKSTPDEQAFLIQNSAIEKAAYVGRYGWVTITVTGQATLDLAKDLIDASYDLITSRVARSAK